MPSHGGKRKGAGRPASTASSVTPRVIFALSAEDHDALKRIDGNANATAKRWTLERLALDGEKPKPKRFKPAKGNKKSGGPHA